MFTYVLHIVETDGTVTHYIGSTRRDQLARRLRAHVHGYGSRITRRVWSPDTRFYLVSLYETEDRELETKALRLPDPMMMCATCCPHLFNSFNFTPVELHKKIGPLVEALTLNPNADTRGREAREA